MAGELRGITMGMDIYGRKPTSEAGKYFRANIWSWRPIHALIEQHCADLLDSELLEKLGFNVIDWPAHSVPIFGKYTERYVNLVDLIDCESARKRTGDF